MEARFGDGPPLVTQLLIVFGAMAVEAGINIPRRN